MRTLQKPFLGNHIITQKFGAKISYMRIGYHPAIDWAMPKGTPLVACSDGRGEFVKKDFSGYGKHLKISKGDCTALYGHCSDIYVKEGDMVSSGDIIAVSGKTGFFIGKTGYHLHFEVQWQGQYVDPLPHIQWDEITPPRDWRMSQEIVAPPGVVSSESVLEEYTIQRGDSLSVIAKKKLGNLTDWQKILDVNPQITNPNLVYVGQKIKIPKK